MPCLGRLHAHKAEHEISLLFRNGSNGLVLRSWESLHIAHRVVDTSNQELAQWRSRYAIKWNERSQGHDDILRLLAPLGPHHYLLIQSVAFILQQRATARKRRRTLLTYL